MTELNHNSLIDARYRVFIQGENTFVRTWKLKRGEGVCSKGAYFQELYGT